MAISDTDLRAIKVALLVGMSALNETLTALEVWLAGHRNDADFTSVSATHTELIGEFALLVARRKAVDAADRRLIPPDPTQVNRIVDLATEVQGLVDAAKTADQILSLANSAIKMASEVRKVGAAA